MGRRRKIVVSYFIVLEENYSGCFLFIVFFWFIGSGWLFLFGNGFVDSVRVLEDVIGERENFRF